MVQFNFFTGGGGGVAPANMILIKLPVALVTVQSVVQIPADAVVLDANVKIKAPYDGAATFKVGNSAVDNLLQDVGDNAPAAVGDYSVPQYTEWGAVARPLLVTVGGAPTIGSANVFVLCGVPYS